MNIAIFNNTMADMSWKEIKEFGEKDIPVLLPLGVIEEHGPHLPLGTDIYYSYGVCRKIQDAIRQSGKECLIAPPFYWGINHCTGAFPGSFSLRPETMKMALMDILKNLSDFGFRRILCINEHGDPVHNSTILEALRESDICLKIDARLLMEPYDLEPNGLTGSEDHVLVDMADYPMEYFEEPEERRGLLDIHAGAYETASMKYLFGDEVLIGKDSIDRLDDYSLNMQTIMTWSHGGEEVINIVPEGYAGNPADYKNKLEQIEKIYGILIKYVCDFLMKD